MVFDGSEDYHHRIEDPALGITPETILVIRYAGPVGWPGSGPRWSTCSRRLRSSNAGSVSCLAWVTAGSPAPRGRRPSSTRRPKRQWAAGSALLKTGDRIRVDLNAGTADALVDVDEWGAP